MAKYRKKPVVARRTGHRPCGGMAAAAATSNTVFVVETQPDPLGLLRWNLQPLALADAFHALVVDMPDQLNGSGRPNI